MKTFLTTCAAVALFAGAAQAATFATLSSSGEFEYMAGPPASSQYTGSATGSIFGDPTVARDYTLLYEFSVDPDRGSDASISGSLDLGTFSLASFFPLLAGAGSSGTLPLGALGSATYSNLNLGGTSGSVDYQISLSAEPTYFLLDELGYRNVPSSVGGSYNLELSLVSEVPLPATLPLLIAGLGGVAALRRKKKAA